LKLQKNLTSLGIGKAIVDNVNISSEITDALVEQLPQVDGAISNVSSSLASNFGKSLGVFLNYVPESVKTTVCKHSKVAGFVAGACALGAGAYAVNRYVKSKGSPSVLSPIRTFGSGAMSSVTNFFSPTTDEDTKALRNLIDTQVEELTKTGGNVNTVIFADNPETSRTLLGKYAEDGNLPAVKYLVEEKGADVNALDSYYEPRPAIIHAAFNGHVAVLQYLASLPQTTEQTLAAARAWSQGVFSDPDIKSAVEILLMPRA